MKRFERKGKMRSIEKFGILAQDASQIGRINGALVAKKLMTLEDKEEFIAMVIDFAERKSMTISNIKDAVREAIAYLEDNAILNTSLEYQSNSEADESNAGAKVNYYVSHDELINRMKDARCIVITTQNEKSTLINNCFARLENEYISAKEREELLKSLPFGARQLFSGEPIKIPPCLKHYGYQKRGNQSISSRLDSEMN